MLFRNLYRCPHAPPAVEPHYHNTHTHRHRANLTYLGTKGSKTTWRLYVVFGPVTLANKNRRCFRVPIHTLSSDSLPANAHTGAALSWCSGTPASSDVGPWHTHTNTHIHTHTHIYTVGQNRIYAPYMTVYTVISLPKIPYIHRVYMVLANPTHILTHKHKHTHSHIYTYTQRTSCGLHPTKRHATCFWHWATTRILKHIQTHTHIYTYIQRTSCGLHPTVRHATCFWHGATTRILTHIYTHIHTQRPLLHDVQGSQSEWRKTSKLFLHVFSHISRPKHPASADWVPVPTGGRWASSLKQAADWVPLKASADWIPSKAIADWGPLPMGGRWASSLKQAADWGPLKASVDWIPLKASADWVPVPTDGRWASSLKQAAHAANTPQDGRQVKSKLHRQQIPLIHFSCCSWASGDKVSVKFKASFTGRKSHS